MNRKSFIRKSTLGLLIAVPVYSLLSCSGSDDSGPDPGPDPGPGPGPTPSGNCLQNGTNIAISANHGHSLTVSKEDVAAGTQKTYQLSAADTDGHIHTVVVTSGDFSTLATNLRVTKTSTTQVGHTHNVIVSCAS